MGLFSRSKKTKAPAPKRKAAQKVKAAKPKARKPKAAKAKAAKPKLVQPKPGRNPLAGKGGDRSQESRPAARKAEGKPAVAAKPAASVPLPAPVKPHPAGHGSKPAKKGGRRSTLALRRGPNGEPFVPGDLLLPNGASNPDEVQYLLRGAVASEHPAPEAGVQEILAKPGAASLGLDHSDLARYADGMADRFLGGAIEPLLPLRPTPRRSFAGVVERAKHRRREVGAFLRGLDLGRTETSHMDAHAEASLQNLMEWAARLEMLTDADEPNQADYTQFHRVLDQLDSTTEALIIDVELTLRRLRDRVRA